MTKNIDAIKENELKSLCAPLRKTNSPLIYDFNLSEDETYAVNP